MAGENDETYARFDDGNGVNSSESSGTEISLVRNAKNEREYRGLYKKKKLATNSPLKIEIENDRFIVIIFFFSGSQHYDGYYSTRIMYISNTVYFRHREQSANSC